MVFRDGLENVTSSVPYFSSVSTFCHVLYCHLQCGLCWQKLTGSLSFQPGDKQWKA